MEIQIRDSFSPNCDYRPHKSVAWYRNVETVFDHTRAYGMLYAVLPHQVETGHILFLSELLPNVADRFFIDAGGKYLDFAGFCKEC